MLIHRVALTNIKSFARADIELGPGLTAITGENGAGKSTILEAIGYALFGYAPYRPLSGFMRHGEPSAEIAVEFTLGQDERRYRVIRRLKRARERATGALGPAVQTQASIQDVELGDDFAPHAEAVDTFLIEHLGADGIAPSIVFEHVVGVPQGRLTADFLDPPRLRKERFDPLLRTDEYQQAFEALRPLVDHFKNQRHAREVKAAELATELQQDAPLEANLKEAEGAAVRLAAEQAAAQDALAQAEGTLRGHAELRAARDAAERGRAEAGQRRANAQEQHRRLAELVDQAAAAAARVAACAPDQRAYADAEKALRALGPIERQRAARLQEKSERSAAEARAKADHEQAQAKLAEAVAAQRESEALQPLAAREAELVAQLEPLLRDLIGARAQATLLAGAAQRRTQARAELSAARAAAVAELASRDHQARVAGELDARRGRLLALQTERAMAQAQLDSDAYAQELLARTQVCPFWEQPCRNLADIPDVPAVFALRAVRHQARIGKLDLAIDGASAQVAEASAASAAVAHVPALRAQLARLAAEMGAFALGATARRADVDAVSRARTRAKQPPALAERLAQAEERLRAADADLRAAYAADRTVEGLQTQVAGLEPQAERVRGSMTQLEAQRRLAAQAPDLTRRAGTAAAIHAAALDALQATGAELLALEPTLQRVEDLRRDLDRSREGYEAYLRNIGPAGELPARRVQLGLAAGARADAEGAWEQAQDGAQRAAAAFDSAALSAAEDARDAARDRLAQRAERARATDAEIDRLRRERTRLAAVRASLDAERAAIVRAAACVARTEFLRGVLRQAAPLVTEALLADVSVAADEIFGDILGDRSGELRWTPDYDVVVTRGGYAQQFIQLSGGEQMSAALAVRLALLRELLKLDVAFFDEPTQHLDGVRRSNLVEQIARVRGFSQLVVISHDDNFERLADAVIRVRKIDDRSIVEAL